MVETDWREILSFSQRELGQADKEKLCESISWMEADDIELNFTDLKTLFRLAQDILKYKTEQVNNLMGKLETANRKSKKGKSKTPPPTDSPASTDSVLETIAHQEEVIKANKELLEQLYSDIAELEGKKNNLEKNRSYLDKDSDSSRDALSEMDAVVKLENEVSMKNRHIRKLLSDVNTLEDENARLKEKVTVLRDKLLEATQLIDNLTEQLISINNECSQLKEILGKSEKAKVELSCEIDSLRREVFEKDSNRENIYEEIKSKVQHWKNIARTKKAELDAASIENEQLKESLTQVSKQISSPKIVKNKSQKEEQKIKELQEKLIEAANEMEQSASLITILRAENRQLKGIIEETPESTLIDTRNESDDGKQRILINKLKRKVRSLSISLQGAEEMVSIRENELAEIASELQLLQSDQGINTLLQGLKHKKRELKAKDEGIKSLVQEVNNMSQLVSDLQLENEALRQKFNIPVDETILTDSIVKKYRNMDKNNIEMCKKTRRLENEIVELELQNRNLNGRMKKITKHLNSLGYTPTEVDEISEDSDIDKIKIPPNGAGNLTEVPSVYNETNKKSQDLKVAEKEIEKLAEENEGLRKGLQEILDFLKDNSTTSSGILSLQCPSLEALLTSMKARHAAGWFAPHMVTIMELRAAMGGRDALLTALHEARTETFEVMAQLSKEVKKSSELERKLEEVEITGKQNEENIVTYVQNDFEFGSWMFEKDQNNIDLSDKTVVENMIDKGNLLYESKLKKGLEYFHEKFKTLYDKISSMAIQAADDNNKWSIQEEQYKAQIENMKGLIQQEDEDVSENSPGLVSIPNAVHLQRKCSYLEESYKYIRTLNENIKNENMDAKRQMMAMSSEYETEIQRLILSVANLTDKLRSSVPIDLFWKQNLAFNEIIMKYRKVLDETVQSKSNFDELLKRLENDKLEIINNFQKQINERDNSGFQNINKVLTNIEESVMKKQIEVLCKELNDKNREIEHLQNKNLEIQDFQARSIDNALSSITKDELDLMKCQLNNFAQENKILKEQCQHVGSQLDIAFLQLKENQQRQLSNDMEINLLRHQILDLQSSSDNKAIVARLSGEVLVAHLQASESNKKIECLNLDLNKEKELRIEAEEIFKARQKIFDVYSHRYESKFRYMFEVMQVLRQQYQGSVPLTSIENYLNIKEDLSRETHALNEKLQDIEDLRSNLITKHSVFDQILDVSKNKCLMDNNSCSHKLKAIMAESMHSREIEHINKKIKLLEQSREDLIKHCNNLEKTLVLVNQGFEKSSLNGIAERKHSEGEINVTLELEDIQSDDDSSSRKSQTITLPKPQVLKLLNSKTGDKSNGDKNGSKHLKENVGSPRKIQAVKQRFEDKNNDFKNGSKHLKENVNLSTTNVRKADEYSKVSSVQIQTISFEYQKHDVTTQTIADVKELEKLKQNINILQKDIEKKNKELGEALSVVQKRNKDNLTLSSEKIHLEANIQRLQANTNQKDKVIENLQIDIDDLRNQLHNFRNVHMAEINRNRDTTNAENKALILAIKQLESDKNMIAAEYKDLLSNERNEYSNTIKDLNVKVMELQAKIDRKGSGSNGSNGEAMKEFVNKYIVKIVELEDKSFKLQSELDECKSELTTYQSEVDRWKGLATERLVKMEQLNSQLEERHCQEVDSYKQENQHWLSQLNDTQREHMELRSRLTEQKALFVKQLADKDVQMEQMRSAINNLRTQIINMQTMISAHDPSFDLSAIVEVDEASDVSHHGSDRLEIKFDSSGDLNDMSDEFGRLGSSSTTIWTEPVIERLRRDKQLAGKQNAILRRQIKALAARERRSRLDAQNLKNQVFRISSSGNRVATAESAALHNKIALLQAQLTTARRDAHSTIALWDKWKRAQQVADRWQARFEEKCQEVKKLEAGIHLTKSAVSRLEREKRGLISRINELKGENQLSIEKQDRESPEKSQRSTECPNCMDAPPISHHSLLERVEAQQRRIVALTLAEKGNEHLVSEYEKALAQITSLKGQVLKLESTLLESQIRTPIKSATDPQPELDYWKSYCEMLKEENVQLNIRVSSIESAPTTAHQHRVNDLEQTVLTLRGLVSKLQAEQRSSTSAVVHKRVDSRPSSGRSVSEKGQTRLESHRIEIANLKRSIQDKDLLLERSKEMLKIAAEREDELLRENAFLRRQLNDLTKSKEGFLSA